MLPTLVILVAGTGLHDAGKSIREIDAPLAVESIRSGGYQRAGSPAPDADFQQVTGNLYRLIHQLPQLITTVAIDEGVLFNHCVNALKVLVRAPRRICRPRLDPFIPGSTILRVTRFTLFCHLSPVPVTVATATEQLRPRQGHDTVFLMIVGCPSEIKRHEYRVGLTPHCAKSYVSHGHRVLIQQGAGEGSGYPDEEYREAGAEVVADANAVFSQAQMIVKVKEPLPDEYDRLSKGQILFTYLHLAANPELARRLSANEVQSVAYETIELPDHSLPCLTPMSEIAGRLSVQEGAKYLEKAFGGRGILLGGVPGVPRGNVSIIGGGVVGTNACKIAVGIGANVTILDVNPRRLAYLDDIFGSAITTLYATEANIEHVIGESDIVIGAVLLPGESTPKLIRKEHLKRMKPGAVLVDVAVDQGGCAETTRPTTHDDPIYIIDDVVHYCVANMPGAVARSSTIALTSVTLKYGLMIADNGLEQAVTADLPLARGVNLYNGTCVHEAVARSCRLSFTPLGDLVKGAASAPS